MPFTPAHAAAVRPLARLGLPTSALVVGSMAPDLPYYAPGASQWLPVHRTHSLVGIVTVDLLLGLLGLLVWHGLIGPLIVQAAPPAWRVRFARIGRGGFAGQAVERASARPVVPQAKLLLREDGRQPKPMMARPKPLFTREERAQHVVLLLVALAVGAFTHVVWDEFTHARRFADRHLDPFHRTWGGMPGWQWAQLISGVVGLALVAWWVRGRWTSSASAPAREERGRGTAKARDPRYLPQDTALAVLARLGLLASAVLAVAFGVSAGLHPDGASGAGFEAATAAGGAGAAVLLPVALAVRIGAFV